MYTLYVIFGFLVCYTNAFNHVSRNDSGQHWFTIMDKNYFIEENIQANFWTAVQYCYFHNMQLVALQTQEQNDALYNEVSNFLVGAAEFWSSGNRIANDVDWVWLSTGRPATVFNWGNGEPNNDHKERCLSLYYLRYQTGWWNDENCDNQMGVICESKDC